MSESGRTRIHTRRQRRRVLLAALVALAATVAAASAGVAGSSAAGAHGWRFPELSWHNPLWHHPFGPAPGEPPTAVRPGGTFPLTVHVPPVPVVGAVLFAVPIWIALLLLVVRPLITGLGEPSRHRGLATKSEIRRKLGVRAVRRAGVYTRPGTTRWDRFLLPTGAFGYRLLVPTRPRGRRHVWADWEQRVRLVARTGWGKAARILVPIIRTLPGPAMISSTEPAIFEQTVLTRATRTDPTRWPHLHTLRQHLGGRPGRAREFPVAVADFSDPAARWTTGWPQVRWDPIPDCVDYPVAHRRAAALVAGTDTTGDRGSESDRFFRDSATDVLAAWLHAAARTHRPITDVLKWLRKPDDPTPRRILDDDPASDPSAAQNLDTHLDPRAARTTSGVLRYLTLALNCLATTQGRTMCTPTRGTGNQNPGDGGVGFEMEEFIRAGGTLYLLADPARIDRARPLLSLFATEMFLAAEHVALTQPGKRLRLPFIAVLDELRYGVTVANLPYAASGQRKYGVGFIYAVQSATQEDAVYGADAAALRDAAGVTIVGGIDITLAEELTDRAGTTPVVTATRGAGHRSEHTEQQPALTVADQQALDDGHAVVYARGLPPFIGHARSIYQRRRLLRRITTETRQVTETVAAANTKQNAAYGLRTEAAAAGFDQRTGDPV